MHFNSVIVSKEKYSNKYTSFDLSVEDFFKNEVYLESRILFNDYSESFATFIELKELFMVLTEKEIKFVFNSLKNFKLINPKVAEELEKYNLNAINIYNDFVMSTDYSLGKLEKKYPDFNLKKIIEILNYSIDPSLKEIYTELYIYYNYNVLYHRESYMDTIMYSSFMELNDILNKRKDFDPTNIEQKRKLLVFSLELSVHC